MNARHGASLLPSRVNKKIEGSVKHGGKAFSLSGLQPLFLSVVSILSLFALTPLLSGCAPREAFQVPARPTLPAVWRNQISGDHGRFISSSNPADMHVWWTRLNDPLLTELVEKALTKSLDIKEAIARVKEVRAQRGVSRADLYPSIDGSAKASISRNHGDTGDGEERKLFSTGLDASWEIDIFGGRRKTLEKMTATLKGAEAALSDVQVMIAGETAIAYIDLRVAQERLRVAHDHLNVQDETLALTQARYLAGLSDELAVVQAAYNRESTEARIPSLEAAVESAMNRLAVLSGGAPGLLHSKLKKAAPIPSPPRTIIMMIPTEAMRNRPDIRKAEQNLAASIAAVGEAVADQYPKFTLTGALGIDSLTAGGLLDLGNRGYAYGPHISLPIFNASAIRKRIAVQDALQEQAWCQYEATLLNGFEEVENALKAYAAEHARLSSLEKAAAAASKAEELSLSKYQAGLIDFSVVLDAQRSFLSFEDQRIESRGIVASNLVRIYKSMGGGWESAAQIEGKKQDDGL